MDRMDHVQLLPLDEPASYDDVCVEHPQDGAVTAAGAEGDGEDSCCGGSCCDENEDENTPERLLETRELLCCARCWIDECCGEGCCSDGPCCLVRKGYVRASAAGGRAQLPRVYFAVDGMTCADCASTVENKLSRMRGLSDVRVSALTHAVDVAVDVALAPPPPREIIAAIDSLGYKAREVVHSDFQTAQFALRPEDMDSLALALRNTRLARGIVSVSLSMTGAAAVGLHFPAEIVFTIEYDEEQCGLRDVHLILEKAVPNVRFLKPDSGGKNADEAEAQRWRSLFLLSLVCAIPTVLIAFILPLNDTSRAPFERTVAAGLPVSVLLLWVLATPVQTVVCRPLYVQAYRALVYGGKITMDALVVLSTLTAYVYSVVMVILAMAYDNAAEYEPFFETSTILLCLVMLGRWLELLTQGKTSDVLQQLMTLQASSAVLVDPKAGCERQITADFVQRGDLLKVLPGAVVPADGVIVEGSTHINEATITGESVPAAKTAGDTVYGSTVNQRGCVTVRVTKTIGEGTLANIRKMIAEAQGSKTDVQREADRVAGLFAPFVLFCTLAVFVVWLSLTESGAFRDTNGQNNVTFSLYFALAVLVVSCPCAIGLAVPTAVMVATGVAAKRFGILFRGGAVLEVCHKAHCVVFDKTGTLTVGQPSVVRCVSHGMEEAELVFLAGSAELASEHPLGRAIVAHASVAGRKTLAQPASATATPGKGISAVVAGRQVVIGTHAWMRENGVSCAADATASVYVAVDGLYAGWFAVKDSVRPEARFVVEYLQQQMGVAVYVASGDRQTVVEEVAAEVGIPLECAFGGLLPGDKAELVQRLKRLGGAVCFLGDGVNDSPALAAADVGVAVANATDVSMSAAGVVLMKNDLRDLLVALDISRATFRTIRINFTWAFCYNLLVIPLAAGAFYAVGHVRIPPALAGLSELASSLPVVAFSLLLKRYRAPKEVTQAKREVTDGSV